MSALSLKNGSLIINSSLDFTFCHRRRFSVFERTIQRPENPVIFFGRGNYGDNR